MRLTPLTEYDIKTYGIITDGQSTYYRLAPEKGEKIGTLGRTTRDNLHKYYSKEGGCVWLKSPKENANGYPLWYYRILKTAIAKLGQPDMEIALQGGKQKLESSIQKKEEYVPEYKKRINIGSVHEKVLAIHQEAVKYYKDISWDRRREHYDILSKKSLRPFQKDAIDMILTNKEIIIGKKMGMGKSLTATVAAKYIVNELAGKRCLILCQLNKLSDWKRDTKKEEIDSFTDVIHHEAIKSLYNIPKARDIEHGEIIVKRKNRRRMEHNLRSKHAFVLKHDYDLIIVDEVTEFKSETSDLGYCLRHFLKEKNIPHKVLLTGTPYKTRAADVWGILRNCTTHPISKLNRAEYELYWDYTDEDGNNPGRENLKSLFINSVWFRTYKDYNWPMPNVNVVLLPITPTESFINDCFNIIKKSKEVSIDIGGVKKKVNLAIRNMRIAAARHKVDWVKKFIHEKKESMVITSEWTENILDIVSGNLGVPLYSGKITGQAKRDKIVEDFVKGEQPHFVGTIGTMGQGTDGLQNVANNMIIMNACDSIGDMEQVIGRLDRPRDEETNKLGFKDVNIYIPYFTEFTLPNGKVISVEMSKLKTLQKRMQESAEITGQDITDGIGKALDTFVDETFEQVKSAIFN